MTLFERMPTQGEHACSIPGCGVATGFGLGWPPSPVKWFCAAHLPLDFLPKPRSAS